MRTAHEYIYPATLMQMTRTLFVFVFVVIKEAVECLPTCQGIVYQRILTKMVETDSSVLSEPKHNQVRQQ